MIQIFVIIEILYSLIHISSFTIINFIYSTPEIHASIMVHIHVHTKDFDLCPFKRGFWFYVKLILLQYLFECLKNALIPL